VDVTTTVALPGWYRDPWGVAWWRWWDGAVWTGYTESWFVAPRPAPAHVPKPPIRAGWTALLGMVTGLGCSIAAGAILIVAGADTNGAIVLLGSTACLWAGLLGACVIAVRRKGTGSLRDLGLLRFRWVDAALGLGFGTALVFVVGGLAQVIEVLAPEILPHGRGERSDPFTNDSGFAIAVIVLIAVVGAPFFEELFFRGLVQGTFVASRGVAVGVVLQAMLFGVVHMTFDGGWGNVGVFLMILVVGLALGVIRFGFKRLGPGMFTHATYNAIVVAVAFATWR